MATIQQQEQALEQEIRQQSDEYQRLSAEKKTEEARAANQAALAAKRELDSLRASENYKSSQELQQRVNQIEQQLKERERLPAGTTSDAYNRLLKSRDYAREALNQAQRGEWNPQTDWQDAQLLVRISDPEKSTYEVQRAASKTFKGEQARDFRRQLVEDKRTESQIREKAGLTRSEYGALNPEAKSALLKEFRAGRLSRTGQEKAVPEGNGIYRAVIDGKTVIGTKEYVNRKIAGSYLEKRKAQASVFTEAGFRTAEELAPYTSFFRKKAPVVVQEKQRSSVFQGPYVTEQLGEFGSNISVLPEDTRPPFLSGAPELTYREAALPEGRTAELARQEEMLSVKEFSRPKEYGQAAFFARTGLIFGGAYDLAKRFITNPIETTSELVVSPFIALTQPVETVKAVAARPYQTLGEVGLLFGVSSGITAARASIAGKSVPKGSLVTAETAERLPSTQIRVEPVESIRYTGEQTTRGGAQVSLVKREVKTGEPYYVTSEELANVPRNYLGRAEIESSTRTRISGGATEGLEPSPISVDQKYPYGGTLTAEELSRRIGEIEKNPVIIDLRASETDVTFLKRQTATADVRFQGIELSDSTEIAKRGYGQTGKKATSKSRGVQDSVYGPQLYGPQLDAWNELLAVEGGPRLVESYATGAQRVEGRPLIITEIKPDIVAAGKKGARTAGAGVRVSEIEVETPGSGGTVTKQKVKVIELEEPRVEAKSRAVAESQETILETKTRAKTESPLDKYLKQPQKAKAEPFVERVSRVKTKLYPTSATLSAQKSALSDTTGSRTGSDTVTTPDTRADTIAITKPVSDSLQLTQPAFDSATQQQLVSETSTTRTRSRPRPLGEDVTEFPKPRLTTPENDRGRRGGYDVFVRTRGQWQRLAGGVDLKSAVGIGKERVLGSAAASLKIEKRGGGAVTLSELTGFFKQDTFRASKREPGVIVQRRSKRISSPGEKAEIRPKNLFSRKKSKSVFAR